MSREHHVALQLARGLQADASPNLRVMLPKTERELVAHVQRVFTVELAPHFDAEDSVLAPTVAGKDALLDRIMTDIESDHAEMTTLITRVSDPAFDLSALHETLDRLGRILERHVRREEREYYARVQEVLDEASLARLSTALEDHLRALRERLARAAEA